MAKTFTFTAELFWTKDMVEFGEYEKNNKLPKYVAHLYHISEKGVEWLKESGIPVLHDVSKGHYVNAKSTYKFEPENKEGKKITPTSIGNGSKCTIEGYPFKWKYGKKEGISLSVQKIVVTELIEYEAKQEEDEFDPVL